MRRKGPFRGYDAFFGLAISDDGTVRIMLDYEPTYQCSIGIESRFSEAELRSFQLAWAALLERS